MKVYFEYRMLLQEINNINQPGSGVLAPEKNIFRLIQNLPNPDTRAKLMGIARAESNMGTHYYLPQDATCNNPWGIKGYPRNKGSYIRCFDNPRQAVNYAVNLVENSRYYKGKTLKQMAPVWTGHPGPTADNWLRIATQ